MPGGSFVFLGGTGTSILINKVAQGHIRVAELAISALDMYVCDSALRTIMIARGAAYASAIPFRMPVPVASDGAHRTYTGADATTIAAPRVAPILTIKALEGWHRFHTYSHKTICDRWQRNIMTSSGNIGSDGSRVAGYIFGIGCLDLSAYIVEHKVVVHHLDTIGICNLQAATACLTAGNVHPEARCHPTSIYHKEIVGANIRSLKKSLDRRRHTPRVRRRDNTYGIILPYGRRRLERLSYAYDATISLSPSDMPRHRKRIARC